MSYNKTVWHTGDIVHADQLNNIEDGVKKADQKLEGIDEGAQVNKIEGIQFNGTELTPDSGTKKVNIQAAPYNQAVPLPQQNDEGKILGYKAPTEGAEPIVGWIEKPSNGVTPHIDQTTKEWMIGEEHTGVDAEGKDAYQVYVASVPSGTTPMTKTEWLASLKGEKGDNAVNPFKGWYDSSSNLPSNPVVGNYAYVKGVESTDPVAIYECTTAGTWSDSGRTADTSNVQTFASNEEVNETYIDGTHLANPVAGSLAKAEDCKEIVDYIYGREETEVVVTDLSNLDFGSSNAYIYADSGSSNFGKNMPDSSGLLIRTLSFYDISQYAGKILRITLPKFKNDSGNQSKSGLCFYSSDTESSVLAGFQLPFNEDGENGSFAPNTVDIVIDATWKYFRTTYAEDTTIVGVFSAKIIDTQTTENGLQEQINDIVAELNAADLDKIDETYDEVFKEVTDYQNIDTSLDDTWYYIKESTGKISTSTHNSTNHMLGLRIRCEVGDKFKISTKGGSTGTALAYLVGDENNNPLSYAAGGVDYTSVPLELTISDVDAYYLYVNCDDRYTTNYYCKKWMTVNKSRIDEIEAAITTTNNLKTNTILLLGASFSYSANQWFGWACNKLKMTGINNSVSGSSIRNSVKAYLTDEMYSDIEDFDILAIMHVHDRNVMTIPEEYLSYTWEDYEDDTEFVNVMNNGINSSVDKWYSLAYDYILKKYAAKCLACKDNPNSQWYGTDYGKPFVVVLCTSWHDARITFNTACRQLAAKWGCWLCDFAANIGFSYQQPVYDGTNYIQPSVIHADEVNPTETISIDGVSTTVGWHPLRSNTSYIQMRMATIFANKVKEIIW